MLLLIAQMGLWETIKCLLIAACLWQMKLTLVGFFFFFFFLPLSGAVNQSLYAPADRDFPVLTFLDFSNFPCNFLLFRHVASAVLGGGCTCPCDYLTLEHMCCLLSGFCCFNSWEIGCAGNSVLGEGGLPGALHLCISTPSKQDSGLLCGHSLKWHLKFFSRVMTGWRCASQFNC